MSKIEGVVTLETGIGILYFKNKRDNTLSLMDLDVNQASQLALSLQSAIQEYYQNGQRYADSVKKL